MDNDFCLYKVTATMIDGTTKVLEEDVTRRRCIILENRLKRMKKRGLKPNIVSLMCTYSKVIEPTFEKV